MLIYHDSINCLASILDVKSDVSPGNLGPTAEDYGIYEKGHGLWILVDGSLRRPTESEYEDIRLGKSIL